MTGVPREALRLPMAIAVAAFAIAGVAGGALGVAWPNMRATLHLPLAALGLLILTSSIAGTLSSAATGPLAARFGLPKTLGVAACGMAAGFLIAATAVSLPDLIAAWVVLGASYGPLDAGLQVEVSLHRGVRSMGGLHAAWAAGATFGPGLVVLTSERTGSWRPVYVLLACTYVVLSALIVVTRQRWPLRGPDSHQVPPPPSLNMGAGALINMFSAGLEGSAGQWSYSVLLGLGIAANTARVSVSLYWAGLFLGRGALAFFGRQVTTWLDITVVAVVVSAVITWVWPTALPLLGLSLAALAPLVMAATPQRVGAARTSHVIGYQTAAGGIGSILLPSGLGLLLQSAGLALFGPSLVAFASGIAIVHALTRSQRTLTR